MELHTPDHFSRFHCLTGDCPDTCCAWWEVPVDEDTVQFYRTVPGELGVRIRSALAEDEDARPCIGLTGGRCPFLDGAGLCSLQLQWGEKYIPAVCREHPRFSYDYGPVRERGLCASCPEAARLVLEEDLSLAVEFLPEKEQEASPILKPLLTLRETAFKLLSRREFPLCERLRSVLLLSNEAQLALDREDLALIPELCRVYATGFPRLDPRTLPPRGPALHACLTALRELEILTGRWRVLLEQGLFSPDILGNTAPERAGERAGAYFLYRHWLRGLEDRDILSWAELAVLGVILSAALAPLEGGGFQETFRLFCLEIEHDQENLNALQDFFTQDLSFSQALALTCA